MVSLATVGDLKDFMEFALLPIAAKSEAETNRKLILMFVQNGIY